MKRTIFAAAFIALFAVKSFAQDSAPVTKIVAAAKNLLALLNDEQRKKVQFEITDDDQKKRWSNLPTGIVKRNGVRFGELNQQQEKAIWSILENALSPSGYQKVRQIVDADELLKKDGGGRLNFGKDEYYLSFVGQPSATDLWIIQFGGHHLGLNITLAGDRGSLAPSHTGAQPAIYEIEGKTIRPLGNETDKAFALLDSLNDTQRKQAILGAQIRDLVLGPGKDGPMIQPEGIKGSALDEKQRDILLDLISEWISIQAEPIAKTKMAELKKNLAETWFAWSGPTEKGAAAYFRIQGPAVYIEYAPQRLGGDTRKHIHTIYRDPTNEYGSAFTKSKP